MVKLWSAAALASAAAWGIRLALKSGASMHPVVWGAVVLIPYGLVYLGATWVLGVEQVLKVIVESTGSVRNGVTRPAASVIPPW